jgi:ABC-type Fe3+/spermidine/putrescine transport system ATPase subunit
MALDHVDVQLEAGETLAILGPSGSGKTTLLRVIAGLQALDSGTVTWNASDLTDAPPHVRQFGLMFQEYALFPHRDVRGNVEFGLRMHGADRATRAERTDEVLELVGLSDFATRRVASLSGGEQQRVALARALAVKPRLLMLDEPLGALDRMWRSQLRDDIRRLLRERRIPSIWVTHDHEEAFAIGSRLAIMRAGKVVQSGTPAEVWRRPVDAWTARFLGFGPSLTDNTLLRPGAVVLDDQGPICGVVEDVVFEGALVSMRVRLGDDARVDVRLPASAAAPIGTAVRLRVESDGVLEYPPD